MTPTHAPGALQDMKVLDLTQMLAGPYCSMLLGDQGAHIIKIEPLTGDKTRDMGPFRPEDELKALGGYFQSVNRNKHSLAVNLKAVAGKQILRKLVAEVDVLIENFRAGVMERLGLSYETLKAINPRLVYATIRGFGDARTGKSPYYQWPAFDVVAQAMGGIMGITGPNKDSPLKVGASVGDIVPAMLTAIGILSAVHHARRTGEGQFVDVAMYDGILATCERIVFQHSYQDKIPHPEGNTHPLVCPFGLFPAKDGWVAIACPSDNFWQILAQKMGQPELAEDERYAENNGRVAHATAVIGLVSDWTGQHTKKELAEKLGGKVPFGPVHRVDEILADPHIVARQMLVEVEQPGVQHPIKIANTPIHMTVTPGGVWSRAPLLGEHTETILQEAGYSAEEVAALKTEGVIQ